MATGGGAAESGLAERVDFLLAEIGTPDALRLLRGIATSAPGEWPDPLRWHAAEELGIEDELGFDEDAMLGGWGHRR